MAWRVDIGCTLDMPLEQVWDAVRQPRTLAWVAAPILRFRPIDPPHWPDRWSPGRHRVAMRFLGVVPMGRQWIDVSFPARAADDPDGARLVRDNGSGDLVRVWDHWIILTLRADGGTDYRDRVDLAAGLLTPVVWAFAHLFYRWRQARWRALARRHRPASGP